MCLKPNDPYQRNFNGLSFGQQSAKCSSLTFSDSAGPVQSQSIDIIHHAPFITSAASRLKGPVEISAQSRRILAWVWRKLVGCARVGVILLGWVNRCLFSWTLQFFFFPDLNTKTKQHTYKKVQNINADLPYCLTSSTQPSSIQIYWHNLLYMQKSASLICQNKMKTYEEPWLLGRRTFSPRGLVNPTRSPILTPSGGDPSQQAQPGSITPRRAVKCLLCICRRVAGVLSDGPQHSMCEYSVKVLTQIQPKQYYFIIVSRI